MEQSLQPPPPSYPLQRFPELDGIRGCAIILVLIWHYLTMQLKVISRTGHPYLDYLVRATSLTWSGVDLFFVLSGFLIAGILLDNRHTTNYFQVFYLRRICRIFPLYYLLLLLFAVSSWLTPLPRQQGLSWLLDNAMPVWFYLTFTQNIAMAQASTWGAQMLGITWSLAIEEQFYLLLPLIVRYVPLRLLPWLLLGGIVGAPLLRVSTGIWPAFLLMPCRVDSLFTGALLAYVFRMPGVFDRLRQVPTAVYLFALLASSCLVVVTINPILRDPSNKIWLTLLFGALLLVVLLDQQSVLAKLLRMPWLAWFGKISFATYLIHQTISGLAHSLVRGAFPQITNFQDACITLAALAITLLVAHVLYEKVEKPSLRFGHRFHYQSS
jgi:peptidoglycan/LPS O-acetylase OafA/YrhL